MKARISLVLLLTVSFFAGCDESKEWRNKVTELQRQVDKFGEQAKEAADLVDPVALKEIYRDLKDLKNANEKLKNLIDDAQKHRSYPYIVRYTDTSGVGAEIEVFAELIDKNKAQIKLFGGSITTGVKKTEESGRLVKVVESRLMEQHLPAGEYTLHVTTTHKEGGGGYNGKFELIRIESGVENCIWTQSVKEETGAIDIIYDHPPIVVGKYTPEAK